MPTYRRRLSRKNRRDHRAPAPATPPADDYTPPTTEQLAAETRNGIQANPFAADAVRGAAIGFIDIITERLPEVAPADIAAVLIHTSSFLATAHQAYARQGMPARIAAEITTNTIAVAGEQMHRKHNGGAR